MTTVLFYYSKSSNKPPGKGSNESICEENIPLFSSLSQIQDWRRILSNFSVGEFEYNGSHYRTAEHAFQGTKITLADTFKAHTFCLESGSGLSHSDGENARKNRKLAVLDKDSQRKWDYMKQDVMDEILCAKFSQVLEAKRALLATGDSELWHGARGVPKARQFNLEKIRKALVDSQPSASSCGSLGQKINECKKRKASTQHDILFDSD
jgi:predicted NAD-dependent protein-ADP-ribosyltransferase YbiA (DUF1768 family)